MIHTTGKNLFLSICGCKAHHSNLCVCPAGGSSACQTVLIYLAEVVEIVIIDEDVFAAVVRDLHGVVDLPDKAAGLLNIVGIEEDIAEGLILCQLVADTGERVDRDAGMAAISSSPSMEAMTPSLFVQSI